MALTNIPHVVPWVDVVPALSAAYSRGTPSGEQARTWALVLRSQHIAHRLDRTAGTWSLWVPEDVHLEATTQLARYEEENAGWTVHLPPGPAFDNTTTTALVALALGIFHTVTGLYLAGFGHAPIRWVELGSAHAGPIMAGEWWRVVTALTLHADAAHILGNLAFGGFFITLLCRQLGAGFGWSLVLWSGILGNLINAVLQDPAHRAIGASTAVFGAVGLLSGLRMMEPQWYAWKDRVLPVAVGLIFLGLLGSGGERTDLGGHLFGFLAGLGLGAGVGAWLKAHALPSRRTQRAMGGLAVLILVVAWLTALMV